ncbi:hypothetical protein DPV73_01680 [Leptospira mayottensis]|nr:hypothetical protein DPV73_01680 [Leptospira mayottensis]
MQHIQIELQLESAEEIKRWFIEYLHFEIEELILTVLDQDKRSPSWLSIYFSLFLRKFIEVGGYRIVLSYFLVLEFGWENCSTNVRF